MDFPGKLFLDKSEGSIQKHINKYLYVYGSHSNKTQKKGHEEVKINESPSTTILNIKTS